MTREKSLLQKMLSCLPPRSDEERRREWERADECGDFMLVCLPFIVFIIIFAAILLGVIQLFGQGVEKNEINLSHKRFEVTVPVNGYWNNKPHESFVGTLVSQVYRYKSIPGSPLTPVETTSHRRLFPREDNDRLRGAAHGNRVLNAVANEAATPSQLTTSCNGKFGRSVPFLTPHAKQVHWNPVDVVNVQLNAFASAPQSRSDFRQSSSSKLFPNRLGLLNPKPGETGGCDGHGDCRSNLNNPHAVHITSLLWRRIPRSELERLEKRGLEVRG